MKATFSRTVLRMLGSLAQRRRREKGHDFRRQKFAIIDPILRLFTDALTMQDQKGRIGRIKQRTQRLSGLELGRASGRERVYTDWVITVVADSLEKHKTN